MLFRSPGETAEEAARREIKEETGLDIEALELAGTWWFARKGLLMIGFLARASAGQDLKLSVEVDSAEWQPAEKALTMVHPAGNGSTSNALTSIFCERLRRGVPGVAVKWEDSV